jgi:hypothetical protein
MKTLLIPAALALALVTAATGAQAGCLTGAAVGGVAGHYAGHHALLGAAAGCAVGHHEAKLAHERKAAQRAQAHNAANDSLNGGSTHEDGSQSQ